MKQIVKALVVLMMAGNAWAAVDINTATQSELESVKGLGAAKAKAIIAHREKNGSFKTLEELDNVKGFGKASIDKLRSELTVSGPKSTSQSDMASKKN